MNNEGSQNNPYGDTVELYDIYVDQQLTDSDEDEN